MLNVNEIKKMKDVATNKTVVELTENLVNYVVLSENLRNFSCTSAFSDQTITDIYNLTLEMLKLQPTYCYDFRHISYAILAKASTTESSELYITGLSTIFEDKGLSKETKTQIMCTLVNKYCDLYNDFKIE